MSATTPPPEPDPQHPSDEPLPPELQPDPDEDAPGPPPKPRRKAWWAMALLLLGFSSVLVAKMASVNHTLDQGLRTTTATRTPSPPSLDGKLDDAVWKLAEPTTLFVRHHDASEAPLPCHARLLWDDTALYVAFDAEDKDLIATFTNRDDAIYTEDVFEVFIDADGDKKFYTELEVSPRGVLFDALFPSHRKNLDKSKAWNLDGYRVGVSLRGSLDEPGEDEGWSAELRIPFASLSHVPRRPPVAGDRWRINLFRIDMHGKDAGDWTAWTPTLASDFHTLSRFGWLEFK